MLYVTYFRIYFTPDEDSTMVSVFGKVLEVHDNIGIFYFSLINMELL